MAKSRSILNTRASVPRVAKHYPPSTWLHSLTQKLSEPHHLGCFNETFTIRAWLIKSLATKWLTQSSVSISSFEVGWGQSESSKLLSVFRLSDDQLVSWRDWRAHKRPFIRTKAISILLIKMQEIPSILEALGQALGTKIKYLSIYQTKTKDFSETQTQERWKEEKSYNKAHHKLIAKKTWKLGTLLIVAR